MWYLIAIFSTSTSFCCFLEDILGHTEKNGSFRAFLCVTINVSHRSGNRSIIISYLGNNICLHNLLCLQHSYYLSLKFRNWFIYRNFFVGYKIFSKFCIQVFDEIIYFLISFWWLELFHSSATSERFARNLSGWIFW